jgi:hypothetical protein
MQRACAVPSFKFRPVVEPLTAPGPENADTTGAWYAIELLYASLATPLIVTVTGNTQVDKHPAAPLSVSD